MNILLDAGAGAEQGVDPETFTKYLDFVDRALPYAVAEAKNKTFEIDDCDAYTYCSPNFDKTTPNPPSCKVVWLSKKQQDLAPTAAEILDSIWPSSLRIEFEGGSGPPGVMRTAFPSYLCGGDGDDRIKGFVACSYTRPEAGSFWVAGTWFYRNAGGSFGEGKGGTFTHFAMNGEGGGNTTLSEDQQCGTMT